MAKSNIEGLESLNSKLDKLSNITTVKGLAIAALRVERSAKEIVPVDTGLLRTSITHNIQGNVAEIGTSIEYAAKVEFGIGQKAQPYLTPAFNMNREEIKQDIGEDIKAQIKRIAQ